MKAVAARTHDDRCFVCQQYLHYLKLFCKRNRIPVYRAPIEAKAVLITFDDNRRALFVSRDLPPSQWLSEAFELLGLPASVTPPTKDAHYGLFISLNSLAALFAATKAFFIYV